MITSETFVVEVSRRREPNAGQRQAVEAPKRPLSVPRRWSGQRKKRTLTMQTLRLVFV